MADYKLRLDVDAKELEKKLTKAFQTAMSGLNLGGTGGGASSTVNSIGNATIQLGKYNKIIGQQTASLQDLKDAMTEMMNLEHKQALELNEANKLRQTSIRLLAKENALIRLSQSSGTTFRNIGQLFGGQIGGGTGKGIDYILSNISMFKTKKTLNRQFKELALKEAKGQYETGKISDIEYGFKTQEIGEKYKDNKLDKFFDSAKKQYSESRFGQSKAGKAVSVLGKGAGVPVKVAGIAAGFAGAMGLGKMIIDSSPMLQSMLKLLNVGIMLILRPIGDFIGFMLRPLLIEFVKKVAVPAYREGAKAAKEWGTKVGKALLLAFTNPGKFFTEGLVNPLIKGATMLWFDLEAQLKNLGAMLAPWVFNKEEEYTKNLKEAEEKKAAINIPTLWDGMENSEISNKIQDLTGELPEVTRSQDQLGATTCFNSQVGQQVSQGVTQQIGVLTQNNGNLLDNTSSTDKNSTEIDRNTTAMGQLEKVMERQRQLEEERQKKLEEQRARNRATIENSYDTYIDPKTGEEINPWAGAQARVTEDALKAEADRAAEYYGGFANPDFAWDGRTSAERIGCHAPMFSIPLKSLALAALKVSHCEKLIPQYSIAVEKSLKSVTQYPFLTAGQNQFDSNIIKVTKGRIYFKRGAEGIGFIVDRKNKIGGAIKIEDGNMRALPIATLALLKQLKLINQKELSLLTKWTDIPILNCNKFEVGKIIVS